MAYRLLCLLLVIVFFPFLGHGQENSPTVFFCQVIRDDSIVMFFNARNRFVGKPCADYLRYVRIDRNGDFNGYFKDVTKENKLLGRGRYVNGKKDGYFETYHPNGKMRSKGFYEGNSPVGQWEFFYDSGLPERTLRFTERDTLLVRFVDKNGNVTVSDGVGHFEGFVAGLSRSGAPKEAKGNILHGKPDGEWICTYMNAMYCLEQFDQGKFVEGIFPGAASSRKYHDKSQLNTFMPRSHVDVLEKFGMERCADSASFKSKEQPTVPSKEQPTFTSKERPTFDMQRFSSQLRSRVDRVIDSDFRNGNSADYTPGDHYLTIQFFIGEDGKPTKFSMLSAWGRQYNNAITESIRMHAVFPRGKKSMYFHLKLSITGGSVYRYTFGFSEGAANNL